MPLTASQIVVEACQIAKCPGYLAQAGRALNLTLQDLVLHRNLKVNLVMATIAVPANTNGPFDLEATYLRTYDMWFDIDGDAHFLNPCSLKQLDAENLTDGTASYPYQWASDLSGALGQLYIYPRSNVALTITHRYYLQQPDITDPQTSSTIPWFSDSDYLVTATAARLMRITDDERRPAYIAECNEMIRSHLLTEGDEQQVVKEVILDPRRFRVRASNRPTKRDP